MSTQLIYNFDKIFVNKWEMPGTHMMPLREELRSVGHQFSALNLDHDSGKAMRMFGDPLDAKGN